MNTMQFNINSTPCVLFFGFGCFKKLSAVWNVPGYQGVLNKLASFGEITDDISFEQMDILGDVIEAALKSNPETQPEFDRETIMTDLMRNLLKAVDVVNCLVGVVQGPEKENSEEPGKMKAASPEK